ncbi:glycosyltransferase [Mycobacterium frederiksbergense]|uniref:glycosyltransferase n=1 Tax=Mycolicibacterium frederiksbergense TaxID=117567 RepID=UPI0021F31095|nr:glycosyltransferase [Mycolicibacterium frederiksbergense]MCV7047104.1 glycosyltransferase [Mycolicibacterium frederiksbergense]
MCISDSTRRSLIEFDARASKISIAQLLGAGLVPDGSFKESRTGLLIMIGGAAHKRNEDAAAALRVARPPWVTGILGVGVSAEVRDTLSDVFPCEWFQNISDDELLNLYHRAEFYLMLGTDEGFGLPFVEALAAGCQVIATDHPLAREIVGDAGHLIAPGGVAEVASQLRYPPAIPSALRAAQADRFSWKKFGEAVEVTLFEIAERGKSC